ncbi:IclR family transcriptional regulator [Aquicoccus porphyridii]|nr:IclR family transcriptional regulator [Aquicoccus porphyridii]
MNSMNVRRRRPVSETQAQGRSGSSQASEEDGGRQFIGALARGLEVLSAFRENDRQLGNHELAERTGISKPTVSRITYTLTQLGYLVHSPRFNTYELGGKSFALGHVALASLDVREVAKDLMTDIATRTGLTVSLAVRDKLSMLNLEAQDSDELVGIRLYPGSRVPIVNTAGGRAYLAVASEDDRQEIFEGVKDSYGEEWPSLLRAVDRAALEIKKRGFCMCIGDWRKDVNSAGAVIEMPDGRGIYSLNVGGPAYLVPQEDIEMTVGPMLAEAADEMRRRLGCEV